METGHLDSPDLTITIGYETAKAILVDGDAQAAMQAFLGGRIKVDGDITKMIALQTAGMSGGARSGGARTGPATASDHRLTGTRPEAEGGRPARQLLKRPAASAGGRDPPVAYGKAGGTARR